MSAAPQVIDQTPDGGKRAAPALKPAGKRIAAAGLTRLRVDSESGAAAVRPLQRLCG